jgi:uncharacterized protein (TIGR02145 family)
MNIFTRQGRMLLPAAVVAAVVVAVLSAGCGDKAQAGGSGAGTFTDTRDNKTYRAVKMPDKKTGMAENLNYTPPTGKSMCYENNNSNCDKYGRLYDWNTAKTICPAGWHLPSRQEWDNLIKAAGGLSIAGKKLKARSGWDDNGNGTDDYGFSALPGGWASVAPTGEILEWDKAEVWSAGTEGHWWTATVFRGQDEWAYTREMYSMWGGSSDDGPDTGPSRDIALDGASLMVHGQSVRCIQD